MLQASQCTKVFGDLGLKFLKPPGVIYMVLVHGVQLLCRLQAKVACDKHDSHLFSGKKARKYLFSTFAVGGGAGDRRMRQTELDCFSFAPNRRCPPLSSSAIGQCKKLHVPHGKRLPYMVRFYFWVQSLAGHRNSEAPTSLLSIPLVYYC